MIEFVHKCKTTQNVYRSRIALAVRYEMRYYAPCDEKMFVRIDELGRDVGGGTLESEMISFSFIPDTCEVN